MFQNSNFQETEIETELRDSSKGRNFFIRKPPQKVFEKKYRS